MPSGKPLPRLLTSNHIVTGLDAKTFPTGVHRLLDRLEAAGAIGDREAIEALVANGPDVGALPTLGPSALLAHYRSEAVPDLAVALGSATKPFRFAPDHAPEARILVLIIAPRAAAHAYLKTLAGLTRLLGSAETVDALASATSPEALARSIAERHVAYRPELTVGDLMSRDVQAVSPETLLSEVLRLMVRQGRRGIPVVGDSGEVLGLITQAELLQHFLPQLLAPRPRSEDVAPAARDAEVRDVMQRSVMCLTEDQLISDVLGTMLARQVSQFPVVRAGRLVGFLSRTDLVEKLLDHSI